MSSHRPPSLEDLAGAIDNALAAIRMSAASLDALRLRIEALESARYIVPYRKPDGSYVQISVQRLEPGAASPFEELEGG